MHSNSRKKEVQYERIWQHPVYVGVIVYTVIVSVMIMLDVQKCVGPADDVDVDLWIRR